MKTLKKPKLYECIDSAGECQPFTFEAFDGESNDLPAIGGARLRSLRAFSKWSPQDADRNSTGWTFGSVGQSGHLRCVRLGSPPESVWDAFKKKRNALRAKVSQFSGRGETARRRRMLCDDGGDLDVNRYLEGSERMFWRSKRGMRRAVVSFGIQFGVSEAENESAFIEIASNAAVACEALERSGVAVRLVALASCHTGWHPEFYPLAENGNPMKEVGLTFLLKPADAPLDLSSVLTLGLPGMLRYHGFGAFDAIVRARMPDYAGSGFGYGSPRATSARMREFAGIDYMVGRQIDGDGRTFDTIEGFCEAIKGKLGARS